MQQSHENNLVAAGGARRAGYAADRPPGEHAVKAAGPLALLAARWRADAEVLRRRGCAEAACLLESCAGELEDCGALVQDEHLPLAAAARESGYSVPHLRRLIAQGRLAAVPSQGPTRVRRGDLPRKPGSHSPAPLRPAA